MAQRLEVGIGLRASAPCLMRISSQLFMCCEQKSYSTSSLHRSLGRSKGRQTLGRNSFPCKSFHCPMSRHPFEMPESTESCGLHFSNGIGLRHDILQLLVLSEPPATIFSLLWFQNLTEDLPVSVKKVVLQSQRLSFTTMYEDGSYYSFIDTDLRTRICFGA